MPRWIPRLSYDITVAPQQITVSDGTERVEVEPRVCVSDDGRLMDVGDESPAARGRAIGLFELRPSVRVHGVAALRPLLHGYEEEVIHQALLRSGAANVEFP